MFVILFLFKKLVIVEMAEGHYLSQLERLSNENRQLKKRMEANERENRDLKKSVYDLSIRLNVLLKKRQKETSSSVFDLDAALQDNTNVYPTISLAGSFSISFSLSNTHTITHMRTLFLSISIFFLYTYPFNSSILSIYTIFLK